MRNYLQNYLFLFLILVSSSAYASDPTPLFVIIVAIPLLVFAILFFILCVFLPRFGLIVMGLMLFLHAAILAWASDVGYMETAGGWVLLSVGINIAGIPLAIFKLNKAKEQI